MTDYKKLVEALRSGTTGKCTDPKCSEECAVYDGCEARIHIDAADAIVALGLDNEDYEHENRRLHGEIEALQAEQKKTVTQIFCEEQMAWEGRCKDLMYWIAVLQAQLPKRGEWIVREVDIPGELHPTAFRCMCSMCRNDYVFPRIPQYCPDCGSMNTAKMEVQDG